MSECQSCRKSNPSFGSANSGGNCGNAALFGFGTAAAVDAEDIGLITKSFFARARFYTRAGPSESRHRKKLSLKNAFPNGDGIARLDEKTSAAPLCEPLRVDFKNLIAPCR